MLIVFLIVFIDLVGFGIIIPLLPFVAQHYEASALEVTLLMAVYSLAQFIAAPYWGRLSDRIGRRPVLLISLGGLMLTYIWLGFAASLAALFAARIVGGFMAGNIATAFAYVADITTRENRAKGMGMIGAAFGLGFMIGPAIGGILAGSDPATADFQTPAFVAAGFSAGALIAGFFLLKESLSPEIRARVAGQSARSRFKDLLEALRSPSVRRPLLLVFLATFVFAGLEATFAIWARYTFEWGPEQTGYLFAFLGFLSALVQGGMIGKLTKMFGEVRLVVVGSVLLAAGLSSAPWTPGPMSAVAALGMAGFGFSLLSPSLSSLVSLGASEDVQGGVLGASRSAATLGRVAGPAFSGVMYQFFNPDAPFIAGGFVMVVVAVLAFGLISPNTAAHRS